MGDRATDIACGKSAGTNTIRIQEDHEAKREPHEPAADFEAADLAEAAQIILQLVRRR